MQMFRTKDVIVSNTKWTLHAICTNCDRMEQKIGSLQGCSKCNSSYYCNCECQATHWKTSHTKVATKHRFPTTKSAAEASSMMFWNGEAVCFFFSERKESKISTLRSWRVMYVEIHFHCLLLGPSINREVIQCMRHGIYKFSTEPSYSVCWTGFTSSWILRYY